MIKQSKYCIFLLYFIYTKTLQVKLPCIVTYVQPLFFDYVWRDASYGSHCRRNNLVIDESKPPRVCNSSDITDATYHPLDIAKRVEGNNEFSFPVYLPDHGFHALK